MKLVVAGDWHGNLRWAMQVVKFAHDAGIDKIIQVGDFGFWPHKYQGVEYLDYLNKSLIDNHVMVYWLDGNHENHAALRALMENTYRNDKGHYYIRSEILYSPRGNRWHWDGKSFETVGGAYSIDKFARTPGESWWADETLSEGELNSVLMGSKKVDYLFTHDCPTSVPMTGLKNDPDSHIHRQKIDRVGNALHPTLWFHGHMHTQMEYMFNNSIVYGLNMDGTYGNIGVLDTETNKFTWYKDLK